MKKLYPLFYFCILFLFVGCKNEFLNFDDQVLTPSGSKLFKYDFGASIQRNFQGIVLDSKGDPIENVTIDIGGSITSTDKNGFFVVNNAKVKANFALVKASKIGYIFASKILIPIEKTNHVQIMILPEATTSKIETGKEQTVKLSDGTEIKFDGNFKAENGKKYTGNVHVGITNLQSSAPYFYEKMPGSLLGSSKDGTAKFLQSFGMIHVQLTDDNGQKLQIENQHQAEIKIPIDPTQISDSPNEIPMWTFDETLGIWREEGIAIKVGNFYVGKVSHFSNWSCCLPYIPVNLKISLKDQDGIRLENTMIDIHSKTQSIMYGKRTNEDGVISMIVSANDLITLKISDQCGNTVVTKTLEPSDKNMDRDVTLVFDNKTARMVTITGIVKDCESQLVSNGLAKINFGIPSNFSNQFVQIENGHFSLTTLACGDSNATIEVIDKNKLQSNSTTISINKNTKIDIGEIQACANIAQFIKLKIDNAPEQVIITGLSAGVDYDYLGISAWDNNNLIFSISSRSSILKEGTYTNGFHVLLGNSNNSIDTSNLTLIITKFGNVGEFIDFSLSGSYIENGISHQLQVKGHVKRLY